MRPRIAQVVGSVGERQLAVSLNLARINQFGMTGDCPARIAPPPTGGVWIAKTW
jgi:hypothetical protein